MKQTLTLYTVALQTGELLMGWKLFHLDRTSTGFTRRPGPLPHHRGHSCLATQLFPDPVRTLGLSLGKEIKTWPTSSDAFTPTVASSHFTC